MRDDLLRVCKMCDCLLGFTPEYYASVGDYCSTGCKNWYDAWIQFPSDVRPTKIAYYLGRKYSVDQKFLHSAQ